MERMFEYRMRPNRAQEAALFKVLGASRRLYNDALAEWKAHFEATGKYLNIFEQDKRYNKTAYQDVPAVVTDQVMKRLHRALTAFFKGRKDERDVGFPRFKPAQRWNSIEFRKARTAWAGVISRLRNSAAAKSASMFIARSKVSSALPAS